MCAIWFSKIIILVCLFGAERYQLEAIEIGGNPAILSGCLKVEAGLVAGVPSHDRVARFKSCQDLRPHHLSNLLGHITHVDACANLQEPDGEPPPESVWRVLKYDDQHRQATEVRGKRAAPTRAAEAAGRCHQQTAFLR